MKKTEYSVYCDICKKEMKHMGHNLLLTSFDISKCDFECGDLYKTHHKALDICPDCLNEMKNLFYTINKPDKSTIVVKPIEMLMEKKAVCEHEFDKVEGD